VLSREGDEPGAGGDLIGAGLGIGLIPAMSRQVGTRVPLAWVHVDAPDCHRVISLVWNRDARLSEAAL
jgi:DNA-binding transcriptional LysR family regulator